MIEQYLTPCPGCRRHVADEAACPFCGIALASPAAPRAFAVGRLSRAAVFAGATLVGSGAGCWTNSNEPTTTPIEHTGDKHEQHEQHEHHDDVVQATATTGRIEGTLTDLGQGTPVANMQIHLVRVGDNKQSSTTTDQAGHYVFDHVAPGDYRVEWDVNGNPRRSPRVLMTKIAAGAQLTLDLTVSYPAQQQHTMPMPYGAPPARKRIV